MYVLLIIDLIKDCVRNQLFIELVLLVQQIYTKAEAKPLDVEDLPDW
jgi:hypothetical protein